MKTMSTMNAAEITEVFDRSVNTWLASGYVENDDQVFRFRIRTLKVHRTINPANGEMIYVHLKLEVFMSSHHAEVSLSINPISGSESWSIDQVKVQIFENGLYSFDFANKTIEIVEEKKELAGFDAEPGSSFFRLGEFFTREAQGSDDLTEGWIY